MVRIDSPDPAVLLHGVISTDRRQALIAHVQLDESTHNRGIRVRVPGLDAARSYQLRWEGPIDAHPNLPSLPPQGPVDHPVSGRLLSTQGVWIPRRRPETIHLLDIRAVS